MTIFQHLAVEGRDGPHVTLLAGIEMAGRYWATTSASSAKVRLLSARPSGSVLSVDGSSSGRSWSLLVGRSVVLDPRRPWDALEDPLAAGLAGLAIARIAAANLEQLVGYFDDRHDIPRLWQPTSRVIIVVRADHRLEVREGEVVAASGRFTGPGVAPTATRSRRRSLGRECASLSTRQIEMLQHRVPCAVGVSTPYGSVAVPGSWRPGGSVRVDRSALARVHAELPGPGCVTIDDSTDARPSSKVGVMLRGQLDLLDGSAGSAETAELAITVRRVGGWDGFAATPTRVGAGGAMR